MIPWLDALTMQTSPSILVTVAKVMGSAPRAPGAKMVVMEEGSVDTIGGGHLEMRAIEIARTMLSMPSGILAAERHWEHFSLGPSLGQCCGGAVTLAFERIDQQNQEYISCLEHQIKNRHACRRFVSLDILHESTLCEITGKKLIGSHLPSQFVTTLDQCLPCQLFIDNARHRWLIDTCLPFKPHLMLFGAGHVGAAVVRALSELPCQITWIDERDDAFPTNLPTNVAIEVTDIPEALIDTASIGVSFLVLTHSHLLDQRLTEHILRHDKFSWFGLIGSKTKRKQFEHRLRERGFGEQSLKKMICPIGIPGIQGKEPAVIAASVAAQLLQVWEALDRNQHNELHLVTQQDMFVINN